MKKFLIVLLVSSSCAGPNIIEKPIVFDEHRKELSLQYLNERYNLSQEEPKIEPRMIVLHWTAIPDLERSFNAFKHPELPGHRSEISGAGSLNVSAQFLVDRDGSI